MKIRVFGKDSNNPGFSVRIIGLYIRHFSAEKYTRAHIDIRTPFWLKIFKRNTIIIAQ